MRETKEKLVGYPTFFNYDLINCNRNELNTDCLVKCEVKKIALKANNPKISFDFAKVSDNNFVSNILWDIVCDYQVWDFDFKPVEFFNKNQKRVDTKEYKVICFKNKNDSEKRYFDRLLSKYVVPNYKRKRSAEMIEPFIDYNILSQYDVVPSQFPSHTQGLIISEKVAQDTRFKNTHLQIIPLGEAAKLLLKDPYILQKYLVKDLMLLENLKHFTGEELLKNGFNGKKISF